jgi:8-oxo-dGTP diphosphatase
VGVVVVRDGRLLLIQRGREPGRGLWSLPGGMVDLGETMQEAAAREALEETGLHVEVGEVYWTVDAIRRDAEGRVQYHNVIVDFIATAPDGEPACADDAMDVRWVGPDDVEGLPLTPTMWRLVEKLFGRAFQPRR